MPDGAHAKQTQRSPPPTFLNRSQCDVLGKHGSTSPIPNQQSPVSTRRMPAGAPASREPDPRHPVSDSCDDESHRTELQTSRPSLHQQPNAQAGCLPNKWPHEVPGTVCHRKHHRKKRHIRNAGQIRGHVPRVRLQTPYSRFKNRSRSKGGWHREM